MFKELLASITFLAHAVRASGQEFRVDRLIALKMSLHDVRESLYEERMIVGRLRPPDLFSLNFFGELVAILDVQLMERLDMLVDECDWNQNEVFLSLLDVRANSVIGEWLKPRQRSDLGLPNQAVRIAIVELLHNGIDTRSNFTGIRVTSVNGLQGQGMGGEQQNYVFALFGRKFLQLVFDSLSESLDQQRMRRPSINHTPPDAVAGLDAFEVGEDRVKTGARRCATVLWILREDDNTLRSIFLDLLDCIFSERIHVSEA